MSHESELIVWVRRQWNDYREAAYRLSDISGWHWSESGGGVYAPAPRAFVHAYVMCDAMVEGELAHSCTHGPRPHRIKVYVTKKVNRAIWPAIERLAGSKLMPSKKLDQSTGE